MRPSNRAKILDAALRVTEREGITAVTFDSVAAEAGFTRGGIMYHFPSREDLLCAINQHVVDQWTERLEGASSGPPAEGAEGISLDENSTAYVRVCAESATRAELVLVLEAGTNPQLKDPWYVLQEKWAPLPFDDEANDEALGRFIARLAAEGLWLYDSLATPPLSPELRHAVVERIARMITGPREARLSEEAQPATE